MGPKGGILVKLMGFWNQRNGEICWHFTLAAPCHVFVFQLLSHMMPTVYTYTDDVSKERFVVVSRFRCSRTRIYLNSLTFFPEHMVKECLDAARQITNPAGG